jgi:uncharacterized protein YjbI with pentapeptide repeats
VSGTERRITDLQTKAAELLGSDQAAVRLAGLYALERLAQDNASHRQTIVDIVCGYLRMPFTPPPQHSAPSRDATSLSPRRPAWMRPQPTGTGVTAGDDRRQERQVRLTAQRILAAHLQPEPKGRRGRPTNPKYWSHIDLDLTGATLLDFQLQRCRVRTGIFTNAHFSGPARFDKVTFTGKARFDEATFTGNAWFSEATFTGYAGFDEATFTGNARFTEVTFSGAAWFSGATFTGYAGFNKASFSRNARFDEATFTGNAWFTEATFTGYAGFNGATFTRNARFNEVTFAEAAWFNDAIFVEIAGFTEVTFAGAAWFTEATFTGHAWFNEATFTQTVRFDEARARTDPSMPPSIWPQGWTLGNAVAVPKIHPATQMGAWHLLARSDVDENPKNAGALEL